jgi:hypothetical protein
MLGAGFIDELVELAAAEFLVGDRLLVDVVIAAPKDDNGDEGEVGWVCGTCLVVAETC